MTKQCSACGLVLDVDRFYWVTKARDSWRGTCKDCLRERKEEQRDPAWRPACCRCGVALQERRGSGKRLCASCFAETYDEADTRQSGAHRIKLKPCSLCGGVKERFERGKLCRACKPWAAYASSLRRFGLTPTTYVAMLEAQGGRCYVCRAEPSEKRLCIDHDHSLPDGPESVRGLLCSKCNYARLPQFAENTEMIERALDYLRNPPAHRLKSPRLLDPELATHVDRCARVGCGHPALYGRGRDAALGWCQLCREDAYEAMSDEEVPAGVLERLQDPEWLRRAAAYLDEHAHLAEPTAPPVP